LGCCSCPVGAAASTSDTSAAGVVVDIVFEHVRAGTVFDLPVTVSAVRTHVDEHAPDRLNWTARLLLLLLLCIAASEEERRLRCPKSLLLAVQEQEQCRKAHNSHRSKAERRRRG
jgi:hypothetical protein